MDGKIIDLLTDLTQEFKGLKSNVEIITTDVKELKTEMQEVKTDIRGLKTEMQEVKTDIRGLKTEMQEVKTDIRGLKTEMQEVKNDVQGLITDVQAITSDMEEFKREMHDRFDKLDAKLVGVGNQFEFNNESRIVEDGFISDKVNKLEKEIYLIKNKINS